MKNPHISFTFDGDVSIVNISERIRDLEIEKLVLDKFIGLFNEIITIGLCGEKYKRNKEERFKRAGNCRRKITTMLGESNITVDKIRDTETGEIFKPLLTALDIKPYKNYQDDISFTSTDIATKNTYRDTSTY